MKKILAAMMLTLFSTGAMAKWITLGHAGGDTGFTVYADIPAIKKAGGVYGIWSVFDFKSARKIRKFNYLSYRQLVEYDCRKQKSRLMEYSLHSKHMARGRAVYKNSRPGKWQAVAQHSIAGSLLDVACKK